MCSENYRAHGVCLFSHSLSGFGKRVQALRQPAFKAAHLAAGGIAFCMFYFLCLSLRAVEHLGDGALVIPWCDNGLKARFVKHGFALLDILSSVPCSVCLCVSGGCTGFGVDHVCAGGESDEVGLMYRDGFCLRGAEAGKGDNSRDVCQSQLGDLAVLSKGGALPSPCLQSRVFPCSASWRLHFPSEYLCFVSSLFYPSL